LIVGVVATEDWNFNAIKSSSFDPFQVGIVLFGDISGPEQQVHADFHNGCNGEGCSLSQRAGRLRFPVQSPELNQFY